MVGQFDPRGTLPNGGPPTGAPPTQGGWPAVAICVLAIPIERFARPSRQRPFPAWTRYGLIPGLVYLALAGAWLWHLGSWEGMSK